MDRLRPQELPATNSLRTVDQSARSVYRKLRTLKNRFLNLIDSPIIILLYHRVTDLSSDPEMLAVSPANFRQHLEFLKKHWRILRFEEDWFQVKGPAVVITFDDGYADNLHEALPILEEIGVPATFFVSTGHVGTNNEFWWHQLEDILLREGEYPSSFQLNDPQHGSVWDAGTFIQRQALYAGLNRLMQIVESERRELWLTQLREWAGRGTGGVPAHRLMSREELRRLAASPWATIGAHTVTHSALSSLSEEQQRHEILTSRREIETITGTKITTFSYPFGRKADYNRTTIRLCRDADFSKVAANFPGPVHRWTDPFQLPRHLVRNWDAATFAAKLESFWTR